MVCCHHLQFSRGKFDPDSYFGLGGRLSVLSTNQPPNPNASTVRFCIWDAPTANQNYCDSSSMSCLAPSGMYYALHFQELVGGCQLPFVAYKYHDQPMNVIRQHLCVLYWWPIYYVVISSGLVRLIVSITNGLPIKVAHTLCRVQFNVLAPDISTRIVAQFWNWGIYPQQTI
jgi:hypothetical protein